ncbi:MAG: guanylate kinase [Acidisphaera sp.]|nr:guanylate kinase [Acidisphaera sp.]
MVRTLNSPAPARRGLCLVLSAPSGAGKSTITRALLAREPGLALSVSVTTRLPRAGEQEGVHYFFRDQAAFDAMAGRGDLLEWARVFDRCYGTPRAPVEQALAEGRDVVFDIDWQGHRQLRRALPGDVVSVFILPPSIEELDDRLRRRGDDPAQVSRRMHAAREEISHWREFDHVVVNADLERATGSVSAILCAARLATPRQVWLTAIGSGTAGC